VAGGLGSDPDGAVLLDGSSGNVRAASSSSLSQTGAVSVEIWARWSGTPGTQDIVNKGDGATIAGTSYALAYVPGCSGCGLGFYTYIGNTFTCACQSAAPTPGQWYHLVGTRTTSGQVSFYVNGSLVAAANDGGGALNNVSSGLGVGASGSGTGSSLYPANASLDEAAVYPTALSATQVSNHYLAAGGPPSAPTNVNATAGSNQATVSWTAPAGNITSYLVTAFVGSSAKNSVALGGSSTSVTVSGLQSGVSYTFQVSASNPIGTGPAGTSNAVTPTGTASTYASTVLGDGPIAYYRLDDPSGTIAADSSGSGNAGRYAGGDTQNVAGALTNDPDGATLLDGSSGNIRAANSTSLSITGAITVEAWVKWTGTPTTQDILNKGDGATIAGTSYALAYVPGCSGCGLGFYTYIGNTFTCACQANALPVGSWFHLVGTRTAGGQISFYVNGSLMATANDSGGALNTVPSGLGIGASGSGTGSGLYPANVTIDETAVYASALTATQVSTHYHAAGY
jgi:Concanavalin A-like lectin/glucanases superfamily/Fibronectin type III domain